MHRKIRPVILPIDNKSHNYSVEWWYFNGHLKDEDNNPYSFMDCLFKVDLTKVNIPHLINNPFKNYYKKGKYVYFSHSVISDIKKNKSYKDIQNLSLVSKDSFLSEKLFVNYINPNIINGYINSEIKEVDDNNFYIKNCNLSLNLVSTKNPLLEGGNGYVGTSQSGSYYYSLTNLDTTGVLKIKNKEIKVNGISWMDHQWADAVYDKKNKDKWTWFSFQFENGTQIMCVEYVKNNGTDILIDIIDKDGIQRQYNNAVLKPGKDIWKSRQTKAQYPMSWVIDIPEASITIETSSLMEDQEMIFGQINYWEGPIRAMLQEKELNIKGEGYMELVGYPSDYNYFILMGKNLKSSFINKIKKLLS